MNKKLLARIKELFVQELSTKTGWGRNDVIAAYDRAVTQAVLEALDDIGGSNV